MRKNVLFIWVFFRENLACTSFVTRHVQERGGVWSGATPGFLGLPAAGFETRGGGPEIRRCSTEKLVVREKFSTSKKSGPDILNRATAAAENPGRPTSQEGLSVVPAAPLALNWSFIKARCSKRSKKNVGFFWKEGGMQILLLLLFV